VITFTLAAAGVRDLGLSQTDGLDGELRTDGVYRYTRNPQTVGDLLVHPGLIALTDSQLVLLVGTTFVCYSLLLPFAEEPWLRQQHGDRYEDYCRRVPRFVDRRTLVRLRDS
jgi:protein-S-isoprenylcysteine O-methyltransferase Ste14